MPTNPDFEHLHPRGEGRRFTNKPQSNPAIELAGSPETPEQHAQEALGYFDSGVMGRVDSDTSENWTTAGKLADAVRALLSERHFPTITSDDARDVVEAWEAFDGDDVDDFFGQYPASSRHDT